MNLWGGTSLRLRASAFKTRPAGSMSMSVEWVDAIRFENMICVNLRDLRASCDGWAGFVSSCLRVCDVIGWTACGGGALREVPDPGIVAV